MGMSMKSEWYMSRKGSIKLTDVWTYVCCTNCDVVHHLTPEQMENGYGWGCNMCDAILQVDPLTKEEFDVLQVHES